MAFTPIAQTTGSSASSASATATIPATTAGNHLVAFYSRSGGLGTGALTGVTDSAGQTWLFATRGAVSGAAHTRIECWYMPSSASITSVTFTSATAQINSWNIAEWSGVEPLNPLDVASPDNSAAASSTAIATPAINTTVAGDLILAGIHHPQTTSTLATAGYTALTDYDYSTSGSGRAAYQTGAPIGTYSASWTLGVAQAAGVVTVAFKAAATGGGATVAPDGITVPVALGSPALADSALAVAPDGISVPVALGSPTLTLPGITPDGISVPVALGSPVLSWSAAVSPDGISVPVTLGTPNVATPGVQATGTGPRIVSRSQPDRLASRSAPDRITSQTTGGYL